MPRTPPPVERLLDAAREGRWDDVAEGAEPLAAALLGTPGVGQWAPAAVLLGGWARAEQGYLPTAVDLLERGLNHLDDHHVRREVGGSDAFHLKLVELYLLTGDQAAALEQLEPMRGPDAPLAVRFPAYRALVAIAADRGDDAHAEGFCTTAGELARQVRRGDAEAMVAGDRVRWLAAAGRAAEAAAEAEAVLPALLRSRGTSVPRRTQAAAVLLASGLALAESGDASAASWATRAEPVVRQLPPGARRRLACHADLVRAVALRWGGALPDAERFARAARRGFQRIGARPAAALAGLEEARLAMSRGLVAAAASSLDGLAPVLAEAGQLRRAAEAQALRAGLGQGARRDPAFA
jgi:hypothetical protein